MPVYEYQCNNCDCNFEIDQGIREKPKKKCPKCSKMKLERLLFPSTISIRGNINTLGQQAEANTKKLGRYAFDRLNKDKILSGELEAEKNKKAMQEKFRKINKLTPEGKTKYMMTGEL